MHINSVVIDSNFIFLPFQFKIDYLTEITQNLGIKTEFIIYKQILDELKAKNRRERKKEKFRKQLEASLLYLENFKDKFNIIFNNTIKKDDETTDDFLLRMCIDLKKKNTHIFLATNDSELRKKAKSIGLNVIFMRQKKFLSFE
ncbi:MAG: PIN domain-containing protein [Candidatus Thorarchaeota archaeon]